MSYFNLPEHGDRTEGGVWFDSRPIDASSTWDDMLAAAHTPDCDVLGCDYGLMSFASTERGVFVRAKAGYFCNSFFA